MNRNIAIAAILVALALAGCASLQDTSAAGATGQRDATRPFPAATDQGRF